MQGINISNKEYRKREGISILGQPDDEDMESEE